MVENMKVKCVNTITEEGEVKQVLSDEAKLVDIQEDPKEIQLILQMLTEIQQQNRTLCLVTGKFPKHLDETIKRYANKTMYIEIMRLRALVVEYERVNLRNKLTSTERCILEAIYNGFTQKQIAERSFVTLSTIKNHVTNILKKTGASTSKDAAKIVKELDLI